MATYLTLNLIFIALSLAALWRLNALRWNNTMTWLLISLIILTAIFDSLLIAIGIFDYSPSKILGLKIGYAPIEDFMYAALAVIVIPSIWSRLGETHAR